nr:hypothetical protein [Tanacetum cinerariifolium]
AGRLRDEHVAGDAAVVPPVGIDGGHGFEVAGVVGLHHHKVFAARVEQARHLKLQRREAAAVHPQLFAVQVHVGLVVDGPEIQEIALASRGHQLKITLVPDGAFVVQQLGILRVPVTGHLQRSRVVEVVLNQLGLLCVTGFLVVVVATLAAFRLVEGLAAVVIKTVFVGVDDPTNNPDSASKSGWSEFPAKAAGKPGCARRCEWPKQPS